MRGLYRVLVTAVALAGFGSAALAADLSVKAPVYKAPVEPAPTWTGFYIGGHVGGAFATSDWIDTFPGFVGVNDASVKPSGFAGGGQIGFNYQIDRFVLGAEARGSWTDLSDSVSGCFASSIYSCSTKADWFTTVAGRFGYAWDRALIYGKGGAAWGHFKYENPCPTCGLNGENWTASETRLGWTVGAGIEFQFTRQWSVNVEYDYLDFGTHNQNFVSTLTPLDNFNEDIRNRVHMITVGANYHLGVWP